jgi:hypothetical protein
LEETVSWSRDEKSEIIGGYLNGFLSSEETTGAWTARGGLRLRLAFSETKRYGWVIGW